MRPIKFRFWNKEHKIYEFRYLLTNEGEICDPCENKCYPLKNQDNFIIEQFTGLHDKNGKEIYEGDILKISEFLFLVFYDKGRFIVKESIESKISFDLYNIYGFPEIVSSIHENPELLESINAN